MYSVRGRLLGLWLALTSPKFDLLHCNIKLEWLGSNVKIFFSHHSVTFQEKITKRVISHKCLKRFWLFLNPPFRFFGQLIKHNARDYFGALFDLSFFCPDYFLSVGWLVGWSGNEHNSWPSEWSDLFLAFAMMEPRNGIDEKKNKKKQRFFMGVSRAHVQLWSLWEN